MTRQTAAAVGFIATCLAVAILSIAWIHTNNVVDQDHRRWCVLLVGIQNPKPTTPAQAQGVARLQKLEQEFNCHG